jgi:hypothetical protein
MTTFVTWKIVYLVYERSTYLLFSALLVCFLPISSRHESLPVL